MSLNVKWHSYASIPSKNTLIIYLVPDKRKTTHEQKWNLPTLQCTPLNKLIRSVKFNWPFFYIHFFPMTFFRQHTPICVYKHEHGECMNTQTILHFASAVSARIDSDISLEYDNQSWKIWFMLTFSYKSIFMYEQASKSKTAKHIQTSSFAFVFGSKTFR